MIFPNSHNVNGNQIPQFYNSNALSLPITYNGAHINYRDSSWLKLNICEMFLRNECPNIDNCSLAHPPSNVKLENNKVTVCYDYIKKKDCKHNNCKYYHPHDVLASAILRRGDDTKKNGSSMSNLGLALSLQNPLHMNRSQELFNFQAPTIMSSQLNNNIITDQHMKLKLEVMKQLQSIHSPQAWFPTMNVNNTHSVAPSSESDNIALHPMMSCAPSKTSLLSLFTPQMSFANTVSSKPTTVGIADPDVKIAGIKRAASDIFDPMSTGSHIFASRDNNIYGLPEVKKEKIEDTDTVLCSTSSHDPDTAAYYYSPSAVTITTEQPQPSTQITLPLIAGQQMPSTFSILPTNTLQSSPLSAYHPLGSYNVNNLLLQSLLANNHNMAGINQSVEAQLMFNGQKLYAPLSPYAQVNVAQIPILNQLYYQQMLHNSMAGNPQLFYPTAVNLSDLQQRAFEDTSVAFINDKGSVLETLPVCKDFLQGKCKRNQTCNYVHLLDSNVEIKDSKLTVCKNALKGQCHRPVCKFYHIPTYQLQRISGICGQI